MLLVLVDRKIGYYNFLVLYGLAGLKPGAYITCLAAYFAGCLLGLSQWLCYQDGPVTSLGLVRIQGPLAVTATVCSK
jgi:hypothetical protein